MKNEFKNVEFFSATSDVWSRSNRSFIAVSVHYIEKISKSEEVKTRFIACERFSGRHTNDKVAEKLNQIFTRFGILEKVFFITTDAAGEYVAAMKYYGENYRSMQAFAEDENLAWLGQRNNYQANEQNANTMSSSSSEDQSDMESDSESETGESNDEQYDDVSRLPDEDSDTEQNEDENSNASADNFVIEDVFASVSDNENKALTRLLANINRVGCSSHALDKVGSKDADKALVGNANYKAIHDEVFKKLELIWVQKKSRLNAEIFNRITGRKLIGPHRIRWMKKFDAVSFFSRCFFFVCKSKLMISERSI